MSDDSTRFSLTEDQKRILLRVARQSILAELGEATEPDLNYPDEIFQKKCGAFVTLTKHGSLRGCIGHVVGYQPLIITVSEMAKAAAFRDPRFSPVQKEETQKLEIEISVLSPLRTIVDVEEIEIGKHGILLEKGYKSGLLLPQVATEYGWDREQFLQHTCIKAGLPTNAWEDSQTKIKIFSATVFSEKELARA